MWAREILVLILGFWRESIWVAQAGKKVKRTEEHSQVVFHNSCLTPSLGQLLSLWQQKSIHRPICLMPKKNLARGPNIPGFFFLYPLSFNLSTVVCCGLILFSEPDETRERERQRGLVWLHNTRPHPSSLGGT